MSFLETTQHSPNFSTNGVNEQLGVIFHHSSMGFEQTISHMLDAKNEVSYHLLIDVDGTRCMLVEDHHIAWHAGASIFQGRTRCNDFMLGVAFVGNTYSSPLTEAQVASAHEWLALRWRVNNWSAAVMTDHRQVAPGRKDDLNPTEWARLHATLASLR